MQFVGEITKNSKIVLRVKFKISQKCKFCILLNLAMGNYVCEYFLGKIN